MDEKQLSWIDAYAHMYECFGGVARILVLDNGHTAVDPNKNWKDQRINAVYQRMAEHYGAAIILFRVRIPGISPTQRWCREYFHMDYRYFA